MYAAWSDFSAAVLKHLMVKMSRFGGKKKRKFWSYHGGRSGSMFCGSSTNLRGCKF